MVLLTPQTAKKKIVRGAELFFDVSVLVLVCDFLVVVVIYAVVCCTMMNLSFCDCSNELCLFSIPVCDDLIGAMV